MPRIKKKLSKKRVGSPIVPVEKIKESISRNYFELMLSNWLVTRWEANDYGIDAMVEITNPLIDSQDRIPTGKKFSVQIKARSDKPDKNADFHIEVEVGKIRYWLNSTEPVMLCRFDINSKKMHYRWMDISLASEHTRKNPGWLSQKNVTIVIYSLNELKTDSLADIESYVLHWRQSVRIPLNPGDYFKLRERILKLYTSISTCTSVIEFQSLKNSLDELKKKIEQATYMVAITGPSRSGKSTLLNALVRHEISPVNVLPTTGIPVAVVGGDKDEAEVIFIDGKAMSLEATSESLKTYVSQYENPDNEKKVKFLTVKLVNDQLERGISFLDVPGLDDPSPEIQNITTSALNLSSAVIYVVDASTMATGGFSITKYHIEDLRRIGSRVDKLFFVLNKVDKLTEEQKESLTAYVNGIFKKYGLTGILPIEPILISSKEAWEKRKLFSLQDDTVSNLEESLWRFLISNNKIGLYRLHDACIELKLNVEKAKAIMETRLIDSKKAANLKKSMSLAEKELPNIRMKIRTEKEIIKLRLSSQLNMRKVAVLKNLYQQLSVIPIQQELPSNKVLQSFLEQQAQNTVIEAYEQLKKEGSSLSMLANKWVTETLSQVMGALSDKAPLQPVKAPSIDEFAAAIADDLSLPAIGAISLGLIGLVFGPIGALFGVTIGWFVGLFTSANERRAKKIAEIMRRSESGYNRIFKNVEIWVLKEIDNMALKLEDWAIDRATVFLDDLKKQLSLLDKELSEQERKNIEEQLNKLLDNIPKIDETIKVIKSYSY